jgi:hypothetical protein
MDIESFLNPGEEIVHDSLEQINEHILSQFGPEIKQESDEEVEIIP